MLKGVKGKQLVRLLRAAGVEVIPRGFGALQDALVLMLSGCVQRGKPIPRPSKSRRGQPVRRLLDLDHPSKVEQIETALRALGKRLVLHVRDAA